MLFISLRHSSPVFFSLIISCLVLAGYSEALAAFRFAGGAYNMGYTTHKETENGKLLGDADSLSQRLSLSVVNRGNLYNMRSSPYSLLLGYTHKRYATNIQGRTYSPSADELSWGANITLSQTRAKGLSLYAISKKRERAIFDKNAPASGISVYFPSHVKKTIYSEHGISIIVGHEKSLKSYLSYYTSSRGYTDDTEKREFSHLSLQRGINWLHIDLEERQFSLKGTTERRSIRVGNVRHRAGKKYVPSSFRKGSREWFRLTNWLEISTDLEYSTTTTLDKSSNYSVSFFGKGYRKTWSMSLSPGYSASSTTTSTGRSLNLPVSVSYFPSRKLDVISRTRYSQSQSKNNLGVTIFESESMFESLEAIIRPQTWLTMRPRYSISKSDSNGLISMSQNAALDLTAIRGNVNTYLQSSYVTSKSEVLLGNDNKSDSFSAKAGIAYTPLSWVRSLAFSHEYAKSADSSGSRTELNNSALALYIVPSYRFRADFRVSLSDTDDNGSKSERITIDAGLNYDTKKRFSNILDIYIEETEGGGGNTKQTYIQDRATYKFSKNLKSNATVNSRRTTSESGDSKSFSFDQGIAYSVYGGGFLGRKIYDLLAHYRLDKYNANTGSSRKKSGYSVAINYYLSRVFTLGGSYSYDSDNVSNKNTITRIHANMAYPKLKLGMSYESDGHESAGSGKKVVERYVFSLTKYF